MIAPAMNTRPQEALSYRDLARQQARISRRISLEALPRLKDLVEKADASAAQASSGAEADLAFDVNLEFSIDARGCSRVEGELSGQLGLMCTGCAEVLVRPLTLTFACVIAETEAIAEALVEGDRTGGESSPTEDVLVANGTEVTVAQIVEDEILLNLPERLCVTEPCEMAPELAYPAPGVQSDEPTRESGVPGAAGAATEGDENPFSVLAELKTGESGAGSSGGNRSGNSTRKSKKRI